MNSINAIQNYIILNPHNKKGASFLMYLDSCGFFENTEVKFNVKNGVIVFYKNNKKYRMDINRNTLGFYRLDISIYLEYSMKYENFSYTLIEALDEE